MNYFITIDGEIINNNLSKINAIKEATKHKNKNNIGIGKHKSIKGKKNYNLLPLHFFLN